MTFHGPPPGGLQGTKLTCYPPVGHWHDTVENQHQSHELRFSTDPQLRVRGIFGAFWEKFVISNSSPSPTPQASRVAFGKMTPYGCCQLSSDDATLFLGRD